MLNNIIAGIILLIGGYNIVQGQLDDTVSTSPLWWLKFGGMSIVGLGWLGYSALPYLSNLKLLKIPNLIGATDVAKDLGSDIQIKTDEEKDMTAIYYITERCKEVGNGLELCKQLNDLFFDLHHPVKKAE